MIDNILRKNGLNSNDVIGLTGTADTAEMNAYLLANQNTTQAAYVFHLNTTVAALNPAAAVLSMTYTLQLNATLFSGTCPPNQRVTFWKCPVVQRDVGLPMQVALANEVLALTGTAPALTVTTTPFAHPAFYKASPFDSGPLFLLFACIFPFVIQLMQIVKEREVRLQYHLKLVGLKPLSWWLSWWLHLTIVTELSFLIMIALGCAYGLKFFLQNDFGTYFFLIMLFGQAMVATTMFFSTLFLTVKSARILALVYLFFFGLFSGLGAFVYADETVNTVDNGWRVFLSIFPPLVYSKSVSDLFAATSSAAVDGIRWADRASNTQLWPLTEVYWWLAVDTGICFFLTWYCDNIFPDIMGVRKPPWFFLLPSYWCGGSSGATRARRREHSSGDEQDETRTGGGVLVDVSGSFSSSGEGGCVGASSTSFTSSTARKSRSSTSFSTSQTLDDDATYEEQQEEKERAAGEPPSEDSDVDVERQRIRDGSHKYTVVIDDLVKSFDTGCCCGIMCDGGKPTNAVDGLTLGMEDNTLLCLLGPNGAGKTTTIHILTGGLSATSGEAFVHGLSIRRDGAAVRSSLGVCPQFDVLWDELTGEENLAVFAALKDLDGRPVDEEVTERLQEVDLYDVRKRRADKYSGGMRRRLCVAIALAGNPSLVFLDEPTTGMDPVSRRQVWDIIERAKRGRSVILTTHSMEEADVLGDKIAIMALGKLRVVGTAVHLKQRYGSGYRVVVLVAAEDSKKVHRDLRRDFPSAKHIHATPVAFKLQVEDASLLPELFEYLKNHRKVKDFQISLTTLEDVFLRIAGEAEEDTNATDDDGGDGVTDDTSSSSGSSSDTKDNSTDAKTASSGDLEAAFHGRDPDSDLSERPEAKPASCCLQFGALMAKNWHLQKRKRASNCCQICAPSLLIVILILIQVLVIGNSANTSTQLIATPLTFPMIAVVPIDQLITFAPDTPANEALVANMKLAAPGVFNFTPHAFSNKAAMDAFVYNQYSTIPYVAGGYIINGYNASQNVLDVSLYYNRTFFNDTTPLNPLFDTIFSAFLAVAGYPQPRYNYLSSFPAPANTIKFDIVTAATSVIFPLILFFQFPVYVGAVMYDKENKLVSIMRVMGMRMSLFWVVHALFDFVLYLCVIFVLFVLGYADRFIIFTQNAFLSFFLLFVFWGMAMIAMSFFFTTLFSRERSATIAAYLVVVVSFIGGSVLNTAIQDPVALFFYSWYPFFALYRGVGDLAAAAVAGAGGIHVADLPRTDVSLGGIYGFLCVEAFIFTVLALYLDQVLPIGFGVKRHPCFCFMPSFWRSRRAARAAVNDSELKTHPDEIEAQAQEDDDVARERERVLDPGNVDRYAIRLVHLRKVYDGNVAATKNACFGIHRREAFGLLGQNGAGKTTIASMLSGLIEPSAGNAYVSGYSIRTQMDSIYRVLGVCPQHDLLWADMTAREHLYFFGRIKGMRGAELKAAVERVLGQLNLEYAANRLSGTYSGGMKRRLSIGQALIGNPEVLFLDEPTTGLDPKNRRDIWRVISEQAHTGNTAVVLTTHSMEEAEALCDRVGIMLNGRLAVVGTSHHLKRKFSSGYALTINLDHKHSDPESIARAKAFVRKLAPAARWDATSLGAAQHFHIAEEDMRIERVFRAMDTHKDKYHIVDWALSQTTLDDVFLQINTPQTDGSGSGDGEGDDGGDDDDTTLTATATGATATVTGVTPTSSYDDGDDGCTNTEQTEQTDESYSATTS